VQFVPLIGSEGWALDGQAVAPRRAPRLLQVIPEKRQRLSRLILRSCEPFESIESIERADLLPLLRRIGDARVVLIGEASHGTSEFYQMRARITRELITHLGFNIGQLAREYWGGRSYHIGFGTGHGTVAAAANWDEPMEVMTVRPSHEDSYERLCHESGVSNFLLPLRHAREPDLTEELLAPHLERAIGVIYRPDSEMVSHYFHAALSAQFDEYVWFDETRAVTPIPVPEATGVPEQIALFSRAEMIVGPSGAALVNVLWCRENCRVLVLHSDHPFKKYPYWDVLARVSGIRISFSKRKNHFERLVGSGPLLH
jgi:hypothetical protein